MKNTLRVQRAIADVTQEQLAQAVGVTRQAIHSIEQSKYVPSTLLALKMAKYFNVSVHEIFILEDED
jgi:putative transcriptional regulator